MSTAKKWIFAENFDGEPKLSNFRLEEEKLADTLNEGEVLIEAIFLSVDPYMRVLKNNVGEPVIGTQVSKVLESRNDKIAAGEIVVADVGWRSKTIVTDANLLDPIPELHGLSLSTCLGVMGMPGMTAYFGFLEICTPKPGETVLVNGAAGAVGSLVGQIAKIKGCNVIGFAGTEEKCRWVKELGFDHVFNYKEVDIGETLKKVAPDGIDCYFDNVGGQFTSVVLEQMRPFGRISFCGSISVYNNKEPPSAPIGWFHFTLKNLRGEGFMVYKWKDRWNEGFKDMVQWILEGKIKFKETITEGFENMPEAFMSLFKGGNIGKAIVKI